MLLLLTDSVKPLLSSQYTLMEINQKLIRVKGTQASAITSFCKLSRQCCASSSYSTDSFFYTCHHAVSPGLRAPLDSAGQKKKSILYCYHVISLYMYIVLNLGYYHDHDIAKILAFPGFKGYISLKWCHFLNIPECSTCSNARHYQKSQVSYFFFKEQIVVPSILLQYQYWGIWSQWSQLIFSPSPSIYEVLWKIYVYLTMP